tara:strand:+ start:413 stop:676 length:264 start_codon:yes stop_codon:yes gene_type:complete
MQIFIKLFNNKLRVIDVQPNTTIGETLDTLINTTHDLNHPQPEVGHFVLTETLFSRILNNDSTISELGIVKEQTLNLAFRRNRLNHN